MTHSGDSLLRLVNSGTRLPICDKMGGPVVMMADARQIHNLVARGRVIGYGSQARLKYLVFSQQDARKIEDASIKTRTPRLIAEDNQTYSRTTREHAHVAAWSRRWGHSKSGVAA